MDTIFFLKTGVNATRSIDLTKKNKLYGSSRRKKRTENS
jgi:hypothetical protein